MSAVLVWEGDYGKEVAEAMHESLPSLTSLSAHSSATLPEGEWLGFVSWRSSDAKASELANIARKRGSRFFPVQIHNRLIVIGPNIGDAGVCYQCFRARYLAHAPGAQRDRELWSMYAQEPSSGVLGHTPFMIRAAASAMQMSIDGTIGTGIVSFFDVLTCDFTQNRVDVLHSCDGPSHDQSADLDRFVGTIESYVRNLTV